MEGLTKKIADYFDLTFPMAEEIAKGVMVDFNAIVGRLDKYTEEGTDVEQVVQGLHGFNLEHGSFDMEYNNLQLTIDCIGEDYGANVYSIADPVWVILFATDEYIEPLEVKLRDLPCPSEKELV